MFKLANYAALILALASSLSFAFAEAPDLPPTRRSVIVSVFDARGGAVRDLTTDNFLAHVNGKPAMVLNAKYTVANRRIVVLLDMSGSMAGDRSLPKWRIATEAARDLIVRAPIDLPIAMVVFSRSVIRTFDFSHSRLEMNDWLNQNQGQRQAPKEVGRTSLFDAMIESLKLFGAGKPGDAIYAITDGGENSSRASQDQTKAALLQSGVRLFAFVLSSNYAPTAEEREGAASLADFVLDSGGFVLGTADLQKQLVPFVENYIYDKSARDKIQASTDVLINHINGFWTLDLETPSNGKPSRLKLEIVDDLRKSKKGLGATYPRVLSPAR